MIATATADAAAAVVDPTIECDRGETFKLRTARKQIEMKCVNYKHERVHIHGSRYGKMGKKIQRNRNKNNE